jgi:ribosomal protein L11 methyltransferase
MSDWVEIIIPVTAASAEDVAGVLSGVVPEARRGALIRGADVVFWVSSARREAALEETRAALVHLAEAGLEVDPAAVYAEDAAPESEWLDTWKQYFHTAHITRRIVIVPSWESYVPQPDEIAIALDPGQAFGTGAHASTRLVLQEIEALSDAGGRVDRFLDVGCGSGILAIAVAMLWPGSSGVAVDVEPPAVDAATENCVKNQLTGRIAVSATPLAAIPGEFDLILANIQADVLRALAPDLASRLAAGGRLILSGLLTQHAEDTGRYVAEAGGLTLVATRRADDDPDWSSVLLERPASVPA